MFVNSGQSRTSSSGQWRPNADNRGHRVPELHGTKWTRRLPRAPSARRGGSTHQKRRTVWSHPGDRRPPLSCMMDPSVRAISERELLKNMAWVQALARRLVSDSAQADDVAQATWVRALERPPRGTTGATLRVLPLPLVTERPHLPAQQRLAPDLDCTDDERSQTEERASRRHRVPESGMRASWHARQREHRSPRLLEAEAWQASAIPLHGLRQDVRSHDGNAVQAASVLDEGIRSSCRPECRGSQQVRDRPD